MYCENHRQSFKETEMAGLPWEKVCKDSAEFCKDSYDAKLYSRRTPGLFKVEWEGKGIISLCSKTYYCFGSTSKSKVKVSTKGLVKDQNTLNPTIFKNVLLEKKSGSGTNRGFRVMNNSVYTYLQTRDALSYFYGKRQVSADNVSTHPLNI